MGHLGPHNPAGRFHDDNAIILEGYRQTRSIKTAEWAFYLNAQATTQVSYIQLISPKTPHCNADGPDAQTEQA